MRALARLVVLTLGLHAAPRLAGANTGTAALVIIVDAKLKPGTTDAYQKTFAELFDKNAYPDGLVELLAVVDQKDPLHARMVMVWRSQAVYDAFLSKAGMDGKGPTRMALESLGATYVRETFDVKAHLVPPASKGGKAAAKRAPAKPAR